MGEGKIMSTMHYSAALDAARQAAAAAADILLHYWRKGVSVEWKSDATPVTVADREAELAKAHEQTLKSQ